MKFYLAGLYNDRPDIQRHKADLEARGHTVTSRWLEGPDESLIPNPDWAVYASRDIDDIINADVVVSHTKNPNEATRRGGRHVEFGLGLGMGKKMVCVGPRENIFHWLSDVQCFETWRDFLDSLDELAIDPNPWQDESI